MQSNAVLQFETWSREENGFLSALDQVDRERKSIEESFCQLRLQQKQLSIDAREASDLLGRFRRECDLLQQEKVRLQTQILEERALLEKYVKDKEFIINEEISANMEFCEEVEKLNSQLIDSLLQQEYQTLQANLNIKNVQKVREFLLGLQHTAENEAISDLVSSLNDWEQIAFCLQKCFIERKTIQAKTISLRNRVLQTTSEGNKQIYSSLDLDEMERKWEGLQNDTAQNAFFYE